MSDFSGAEKTDEVGADWFDVGSDVEVGADLFADFGQDEFGIWGISAVGHFVSNAAKTAGKEIGKAGKSLQSAGGAVGGLLKKIPVVGAPMHTLMSAQYNMLTAPARAAVDIGKGKNLGKVAIGQIKQHVADAKAVAPYAQTVVSMVPGVGSGVSAAMGVGLALADGQPIDQALIKGVISAVPGGPAAQAAASVAASGISAAVKGEKFDVNSAVGAGLNALPIPQAAKDSLATGLKMTADIASGKNVSKAAADAALEAGMKYLSPQAKKAFQTGMAVQTAAVLQHVKSKHLGGISGKLSETGIQLSKALPAVGEARKLATNGTRGFDLGSGLMSQKASLFDVIATRSKIKSPADQKGFDMALAAKIGMVANPAKPKLSVAANAGRAITLGMQGLANPEKKKAIMAAVAKSPSASVGAKEAVRQVALRRKPWPVRAVDVVRNLFH